MLDDDARCTEVELVTFSIQNDSLEAQIEAMGRISKKLIKFMKDSEASYHKFKQEKETSIEAMKRKLSDKTRKLEELMISENNLTFLLKTNKEFRKELVEKSEKDYHQTVLEMTEENKDWERKIIILENFQKNNSLLDDELEQTQRALVELGKKFEEGLKKNDKRSMGYYDIISRLILNHIIAQSVRVKNEMSNKITGYFRKAIDDKNLIGLALEEIEALKVTLEKQTFDWENEEIKLKNQIEKLVVLEKKLNKERDSNEIIIERLNEVDDFKAKTCKQQTVLKKKCFHMEQTRNQTQNEVEMAEQYLKKLQIEANDLKQDLFELEDLYEEHRLRKRDLENLINKSSLIIRRTILDSFPGEDEEKFAYRINNMFLHIIYTLEQGKDMPPIPFLGSKKKEEEEIVIRYESRDKIEIFDKKLRKEVGIQATRFAHAIPAEKSKVFRDFGVQCKVKSTVGSMKVEGSPKTEKYSSGVFFKSKSGAILNKYSLFAQYDKTRIALEKLKMGEDPFKPRKRK